MLAIPPGKRIQKAIEAMAIEIVDFPINNMVIFHSFWYVYQRVVIIILGIWLIY